MTIMRKVSTEKPDMTGVAREEKEHQITEEKEHHITLPTASYEALWSHRLEISSRVLANIIWDSENSRLVILGNEESVRQTAVVLSQYLNLMARGPSNTNPPPPNTNIDEAKNLLLMSSLPPELTISSHNPLDRTVSDSRTRRKLESEDSSYDSDHENVNSGLGLEAPSNARRSLSNSLSKSHDDVSRTYSETLAQEYSEYVSINQSEALLLNINSPIRKKSSIENLSGRSRGNSRDASPTQSVRQDSDLDNVDKDQYFQKVEFALKLGYPEDLTKKALKKVGMSACQDDLVKELIRLHQSKSVDPKETLLKESCGELIKSTQKDVHRQESSSEPVQNNLRPIVVDGSNVAMAHGNSEIFSCRGIQICVEYFKNKGHSDITVFVPNWRKENNPDKPMLARAVLEKLEKEKILIYTPSRTVEGKRIVCHDDRYILKLALDNGGIVVSNDNYRELIKEFKPVIEERILPYAFVKDNFMPPDDPLGRNGPSLDVFLRNSTSSSRLGPSSTQPCPYEKKCTYGNKCKYYHPERVHGPHKSVSDKLKEQSKRQIQEVRTRNTSRDSSPGEFIRNKSSNLPLRRTESDQTAFGRKSQPQQHQQQVSRTHSSRPFAHPQYAEYPKTEVSKSKSVENGGRLNQRMSSVPTHPEESCWNPGLEMGCLSSYGLQPPVSRPWAQFAQPPPPQHRKLERQLTINPSFDPRINKADYSHVSPAHNSPLLTSEVMEYMRKNHPPPPFGLVNISEQSDHQNVTRNASAPDTIKQWKMEPSSGQHSRSDSQLNRGECPVNRTFSADPFSHPDSWLSPLSLGTSIWAGPVSRSPPPVSPSHNLGPVGSKPVGHTDSRHQQYVHLCNIFPARQVQEVMALLPEERDGPALARKIIEIFPPNN